MDKDSSLFTLDAQWLAALGMGTLLPRSLAQWEPLVLEGLALFLNTLPACRIERMVQSQLLLGLDVPLPQRITTLLLQCPTLHKLGQVLARQQHLPQALREQLRQLESTPARTDAATVEELVHRLQAHMATFAEAPANLQIAAEPLAEGSVALVLPFSWHDDTGEQQGVFKVLRPGVADQLDEELLALPAVAQFLETRGQVLQLPALDYAGTLDGIAKLLREEIRLEREQQHLLAAHTFYAHTPAIHIPRLLPWSAPWVTAMERLHGQPLAEAALPAYEKQRLAYTAIDALLAQPFWTAEDPALFHGDLHGGNLMLTDEGRLAVLDWALIAPMPKSAREAVVAAMIGGITLNAGQLRQAIAQLGDIEADDPILVSETEAALNDLVRPVYGLPAVRLAGFDWLLGLLDKLALEGHIQVDPALSLFRKTWLSLAGVLSDLGGKVSPDLPLTQRGLSQFVSEWPARWFVLSTDAAYFGTHVSNGALTQALLSASVAGWQAGWRQTLLTANTWTAMATPSRNLRPAG